MSFEAAPAVDGEGPDHGLDILRTLMGCMEPTVSVAVLEVSPVASYRAGALDPGNFPL